MIPIQINNKPGADCNGFNGNLNSWYYGLSPEFKNKMINLHNNIGILAQFDTVNSPYYKRVNVDQNYINFLKNNNNNKN